MEDQYTKFSFVFYKLTRLVRNCSYCITIFSGRQYVIKRSKTIGFNNNKLYMFLTNLEANNKLPHGAGEIYQIDAKGTLMNSGILGLGGLSTIEGGQGRSGRLFSHFAPGCPILASVSCTTLSIDRGDHKLPLDFD